MDSCTFNALLLQQQQQSDGETAATGTAGDAQQLSRSAAAAAGGGDEYSEAENEFSLMDENEGEQELIVAKKKKTGQAKRTPVRSRKNSKVSRSCLCANILEFGLPCN